MNSMRIISQVVFADVRSATTAIGLTQARCVHHHKDLETGGLFHFLGSKRGGHKSNRNTHINEKKFRRLRNEKVVEIELENDVEMRKMKNATPEESRLLMLKKGVNPYKEVTPRDWKEQQLTYHSFYQNIDPYIPPEEAAPWTMELGEKKNEVTERVKHKWYNYWHGSRRIKKKVGFEKFSLKEFCTTAEQLYVEAHNALMSRDKPLLHKLLTEMAFAKMWPDVEKGSVSWKFLRFNEPSKVVSVRCTDQPAKSGNDIAQIIVRMHVTQTLAVYDRFGHLLLGSTDEPKKGLEYVVFENHIANVDGRWRINDKIYPHWLSQKQGLIEPVASGEIADEPSAPQRIRLGMDQQIEKAEKKHAEKKRLGIAK